VTGLLTVGSFAEGLADKNWRYSASPRALRQGTRFLDELSLEQSCQCPVPIAWWADDFVAVLCGAKGLFLSSCREQPICFGVGHRPCNHAMEGCLVPAVARVEPGGEASQDRLARGCVPQSTVLPPARSGGERPLRILRWHGATDSARPEPGRPPRCLANHAQFRWDSGTENPGAQMIGTPAEVNNPTSGGRRRWISGSPTSGQSSAWIPNINLATSNSFPGPQQQLTLQSSRGSSPTEATTGCAFGAMTIASTGIGSIPAGPQIAAVTFRAGRPVHDCLRDLRL